MFFQNSSSTCVFEGFGVSWSISRFCLRQPDSLRVPVPPEKESQSPSSPQSTPSQKRQKFAKPIGIGTTRRRCCQQVLLRRTRTESQLSTGALYRSFAADGGSETAETAERSSVSWLHVFFPQSVS